jgi:hypothetical protein
MLPPSIFDGSIVRPGFSCQTGRVALIGKSGGAFIAEVYNRAMPGWETEDSPEILTPSGARCGFQQACRIILPISVDRFLRQGGKRRRGRFFVGVKRVRLFFSSPDSKLRDGAREEISRAFRC